MTDFTDIVSLTGSTMQTCIYKQNGKDLSLLGSAKQYYHLFRLSPSSNQLLIASVHVATSPRGAGVLLGLIISPLETAILRPGVLGLNDQECGLGRDVKSRVRKLCQSGFLYEMTSGDLMEQPANRDLLGTRTVCTHADLRLLSEGRDGVAGRLFSNPSIQPDHGAPIGKATGWIYLSGNYDTHLRKYGQSLTGKGALDIYNLVHNGIEDIYKVTGTEPLRNRSLAVMCDAEGWRVIETIAPKLAENHYVVDPLSESSWLEMGELLNTSSCVVYFPHSKADEGSPSGRAGPDEFYSMIGAGTGVSLESLTLEDIE